MHLILTHSVFIDTETERDHLTMQRLTKGTEGGRPPKEAHRLIKYALTSDSLSIYIDIDRYRERELTSHHAAPDQGHQGRWSYDGYT